MVENFTGAIGTVIFVAYLSALCQNPLHTATQYALLTALAAVGRTYLSSGAGFVADATGWVWFFVISALAALPSLVLLWWLQARGHFERLAPARPNAADESLAVVVTRTSNPLGSGSRPRCGNTCHFSRLSHSNGSPSQSVLAPDVEQAEMPAGPFHFLDRAAVAGAARLVGGAERPCLGVDSRATRRCSRGRTRPSCQSFDRQQLGVLRPAAPEPRTGCFRRYRRRASTTPRRSPAGCSSRSVPTIVGLLRRDGALGLLEAGFDDRARQHGLVGDGADRAGQGNGQKHRADG